MLVLRSNALATSWSNATYVTEMVKAPAWTWIATGAPSPSLILKLAVYTAVQQQIQQTVLIWLSVNWLY